MATTPPRLTTTTYGVLGLLAVRPHSTYELAKAMDRSVGRAWPRAQSKLFEEPKKLVLHGYATSHEDFVGRRPRTVYTITRSGRRALAAWLADPGDGPALEFEGWSNWSSRTTAPARTPWPPSPAPAPGPWR